MRRTVYGQTLPFPWEPFSKIYTASLLVKYLHKGKHRKCLTG